MTQPVLHDQQPVAPPGLGIDHPVRMQPGGGQARREQIGRGAVVLFEDPEHVALDTGEDAGGEHGGGGPVLDIGAGAGDLVQGTARQAPAGERGVEIGQAERQRWRRMRRGAMPLQFGHDIA